MGLHEHANVLHVVHADVHHLHGADVLKVGHANGLRFEHTDVDGPVVTDAVGLVAAHGLVSADADVHRLLQIDAAFAVLVDGKGFIKIDFFGAPAMHINLFVAFHHFGAVAVDGVELIAVDDLAPVIAHPFVFVVLDLAELVLLRMQP